MADLNLIQQLQSQIDGIGNAAPSPMGKGVGKRSRKPARNADADMRDPDAAFSKIIALVNVSDRSEHAIRERLSQVGYEHTAIDEAVERAKGYGFIDDLRYAGVLARSRISQGKGAYGIERELRQHGINAYDVPGWPEEFGINDDTELDRAIDALKRRPPNSKNLRESAFRRLVGKGFSTSVASSAARIWCDSLET